MMDNTTTTTGLVQEIKPGEKIPSVFLSICFGSFVWPTVLTRVVIATARKKKGNQRRSPARRMYPTPYFRRRRRRRRPVLDHLMLYTQRDAPISKLAGGRTRKPTHHQPPKRKIRVSPGGKEEKTGASALYATKRNHAMQTQRGVIRGGVVCKSK